MSWRDSTQEARWRGIPFQVEAHSAVLGRRTAAHEFPQRDTGYVEDLGRALRQFSVTGFVLGPDYQVTRDQLILACEAEGPGELAHPYLGTFQATLESFSLEESTDEGGLCRITLNFVEPGRLEFPRPVVRPESALASAAAAAQSFADQVFAASWSLDGPAWLRADAIREVTAGVAAVRAVVFGPAFAAADIAADIASALDDLELELAVLIDTPAALAARWAAAFALLGDWWALLQVAPEAGSYGGATASEEQAQANATAHAVLLRRGAVIAAAQALATTTFALASDATTALEELTAACEADPEGALEELRASVSGYLRRVALGLPSLSSYTAHEPTPSLVVSWELYGELESSSAIVQQNGVAHPGFCLGALQVVTP